MADTVVNHPGGQNLDPKYQDLTRGEQNMEAANSHCQNLHGDCMPIEKSKSTAKSTSVEMLDKGYLQYGCAHYRRRCCIRAPCCNEVFDCRHCHNEAKNNIKVDQKCRHEIPRHRVQQVDFCCLFRFPIIWFTAAPLLYVHNVTLNKRFAKSVSTVACVWEDISARLASCLMMIHQRINITVMVAEYAGSSSENHINSVKNGEDDSKALGYLMGNLIVIVTELSLLLNESFVAELVEGRISSIVINAVSHNFEPLYRNLDLMMYYLELIVLWVFHPGCCYSILLKNSHPCVEGAMHHDCPVCFEYLFESRNDVTVMPCGHTIHKSCLKEMQEHYQYACPLCSKSVCDMSKVWERFDMEIAATLMPEPYQNMRVWILCNDCETTSEVPFHVVAQKCPRCKSYNTRRTRGR
ncbi:unnamed protein product [Thlaspi arvense]|uniref:Uncharacterized protein n=1 Tax=Thlaspi arvense TaxID=13288 RepID=A0AAU9SZZ9_THLAR|nr:unnamed protein product [Thlaspi arvense]